MKAPKQLRILVIVDDPLMVQLLRIGLTERGHSVDIAVTAAEGERILQEVSFDAILLDSESQDQDGVTAAQSLRERPSRPAIVMLTGPGDEDRMTSALAAGADEYVSKPISYPELVTRITSAVRRTRGATGERYQFGEFHLDLSKRRLFCGHAEVPVTRSEYLLLRALAMHRGEIVSRRMLMQAVWGSSSMNHGALDALVKTLRDKLNGEEPGLIATVRGSGYSLMEEVEAAKVKASS